MEPSNLAKIDRKAPFSSAPTITLSYYAGTRRLPNLPDGREVWQAFVDRLWRTFYELPLDGTDLARIRRRLAVTGRTR
jgi:hypothetical protein